MFETVKVGTDSQELLEIISRTQFPINIEIFSQDSVIKTPPDKELFVFAYTDVENVPREVLDIAGTKKNLLLFCCPTKGSAGNFDRRLDKALPLAKGKLAASTIATILHLTSGENIEEIASRG